MKLILYVAAAAAVVAILSIVIVLGVRNRREKAGEVPAETQRLPVQDFNPDDLIIPKEFTEVWRQDWVPYREQKRVWTDEDTEPFWSDTKEVLLEVLEKQTVDTLMRNLSPAGSGKKKQ